ncbi:ARM repeat-containing protein [Microthyrium microscopicum]|uniref:MMS19 nucleotide excision repair protein n=1 Tax=Microthyrium microscopicum TaxID=703497 RepID=A0A6A6US53_9PEZI|nr:ARM repeat-containing protein [Microthyrium microscopicum]
MADIARYLYARDNSNPKEAFLVAQQAAKRIENKELKLVDLIAGLGEYLNHESAITRDRTMAFLADVLGEIPNGILPRQHRVLLLDFVISRIEDREVGIGSCAKALLALENRGQWDSARAAQVMTSLLENTYPLNEAGSQEQRYQVLVLIDLLMAKYRDAMLTLHQGSRDFLPRFIAYFDGEKDPRNLMIVFAVLAVISTEWDISVCVQQVFDAAFNYFPITFRPPQDDRYKITAQDLKDRLRACISANSGFAPYAYPALLDKLDSTAVNTKRDVLQAIHDTIISYGPRTVALYSITLWDAVKYEILQVQEDDLAVESLRVLAGISMALDKGSRDGLVAYLKPVIKESNEHLEDAPTKQSDAACRILYSIASSTADSCNIIIAGVLPHLFQLYQATEDVPKKRSLVQVLAKLIEATCVVFGDWQRAPPLNEDDTPTVSIVYGRAANSSLKEFSNQAFELLTRALVGAPVRTVSFRLSLLDTTLQLSKAREILNDSQISSLIRLLNDIILVEESYGKDEIKVKATDALVEIAKQKPQLVIDHSFPAFLSKLPDTDINYTERYVPVLEAFSKFGVEGNIFNTVVLRLKNKLNAAVHQGASASYIQAILSALIYVFTHTDTSLCGTDETCPFYLDVVQPLLTTTVQQTPADAQADLTLGLIGRLCNEILRHQSAKFQQKSLVDHVLNQPPVIATYLLAACRREVSFQIDIPTKIRSLITPNGSTASELQQISLWVNKFFPSAELKTKLKPILDEILGSKSDQKLSQSDIRVAFALLNALIFRNAPLLGAIFPILLTALADPDTGDSVAHGFSALLQPSQILTKENHCVLSVLYKQKTFAILVPDIATQVRTTNPELKRNYLVALSGILRWLPFAVIEPEVSTLIPLLLQTLDLKGEEDIRAGAVDELTSILENNDGLNEHASSVISRLLSCTGAGNPPTLRAKALRCLLLVTEHLKLENILPYRKSVIKSLTAALDDRKRSVRSEAVKCRRKWIELDQVGDEDD